MIRTLEFRDLTNTMACDVRLARRNAIEAARDGATTIIDTDNGVYRSMPVGNGGTSEIEFLLSDANEIMPSAMAELLQLEVR
jgi:hypothetical protein